MGAQGSEGQGDSQNIPSFVSVDAAWGADSPAPAHSSAPQTLESWRTDETDAGRQGSAYPLTLNPLTPVSGG